MPRSSLSSAGLRSTEPKNAGTVSASRCRLSRLGVGTTNKVTAMPNAARTTISQKMPGTPITLAAIGPATSAIRNDAPIVMPTTAIALVRLFSDVRSATMARITAPTAPAPCSARPTITPLIEVE